MSTVGSFGTFTTARLGIYAAQKALAITGNNIANINTKGYTRQKLDQVSLRLGASDRYSAKYDTKVGNGVRCIGVSQMRDPYLDIRFRTESSKLGALDAKMSGLEDISAILDEVGMGDDEHGIIYAQLENLKTALNNFNDHAGEKEYETQVREAASALTSLLNSAAKSLKEVEENTVDKLHSEVENVNSILNRIRDLNSAIRKSDIHGDNALEMRDERNLLIDELAEKMKIDVIYTEEDIGAGLKVEKLTIKLANANPDPKVETDSSTLVDGVFATQFSIDQVEKTAVFEDGKEYFVDEEGNKVFDKNLAAKVDDEYYRMTIDALKDKNGTVLKTREPDPAAAGQYKTVESKPVALDDNDLYGALQSIRELLTEEGEFASKDEIDNIDEDAAIKRGIPYFQKSLDLIARKIATEFNKANNDFLANEKGNYIKADGTEILYNGQPINRYDDLTDAEREQRFSDLEGWGGVKMGGNLFSNRGDGDDAKDITAANISIALSWADGVVHLERSFTQPKLLDDIASTDNDNIRHMISLMDKTMDYNPREIQPDAQSEHLFRGDFSEMFNNMNSVLANNMHSTNTILNTSYIAYTDLDMGRDSVSSVDLNDEAMNLMQYQKSYAAACRLMTTLDDVLDKLINGTGVTR